MKRPSIALSIALPVVLLASCTRTPKAEDMHLQQSLIGTWVTPGGLRNPRETEWGPMLFELTFMTDGMMTIKLTAISSTGELDSVVNSGPFQVAGQQFVSEVINDEEPVPFEIRGDRLFIQIPGEPMELVRANPSDHAP